ncbi:MAG: hypothetical protein U0U66_05665 [Cytophagaceae bacterium]
MKNLYTIILSIVLLVIIVSIQSFIRIDYLLLVLIISGTTAFYLYRKTDRGVWEIVFKSILIVVVYLAVFTPVIKNIFNYYFK